MSVWPALETGLAAHVAADDEEPALAHSLEKARAVASG
jgi:hypothetical protein